MNRIEVRKDMRLGKIAPSRVPDCALASTYDNLEMWVDTEETTYKVVYIADATTRDIVARVALSRVRSRVWEVDMCSIDSKYQGFGIAPSLYYWIMLSLDISLKAGYQQSPGGRGIWYDLAALPEVSVLVRRRGSEFAFAERDDEMREVCSDQFDCYEYETSEVIAVLN